MDNLHNTRFPGQGSQWLAALMQFLMRIQEPVSLQPLLLCAGATDAARGAADIVLTRPGLSVIVSAIIGARKIFQRMTTYSKYTVAMTFRICFTFGLLTVIYNW